MRPTRILVIALALASCTTATDPKDPDTDTEVVDTDTDTVPETDDTEVDTVIDTDDTDDTDGSSGNETADTGPIDSFFVPDPTADTGFSAGTGATGDTGGFGATGDTGPTVPVGCPPGEVEDCDGDCYPEALKGDGTCHIGGFGNPNFNCAVHDFDDGDCLTDTAAPPPPPCDGPNQVLDCDGNCSLITFVGDGVCDDGTPNFLCPLYSADGGDCAPDTDLPVPTADTADTADTELSVSTGETGLVVDTDTATIVPP